MERVSAEIDALFDLLLRVPDDARARLYEAMRYAAIGGGKRLRPAAGVRDVRAVQRRPEGRAAGGGGGRVHPCLFADP
jgi:farnesyl diphosphate synthase